MISGLLIDIAQAFNRFYIEHRVICDDVAVQNARLQIVQATATVLKKGLALLGIEAPEKMQFYFACKFCLVLHDKGFTQIKMFYTFTATKVCSFSTTMLTFGFCSSNHFVGQRYIICKKSGGKNYFLVIQILKL